MILVFGNISYDVILPLKDLPGPHEKVLCEGAVTGFGGSAANTAWWLGKMGIPVRLSGAAGKDIFGEAHLASLEEGGVQVSGVDRVEEGSGMAVVFSLKREKRMIRVPGANAFGRFNPGLLDGCRLVYLSGINVPVRRQFAAEARSRGIPVVCGWHGAQNPGLAAMVDGFIMNADEGERLTGRTDPWEIIRALGGSFAAITLPEGGCVVSDGIELRQVSAPELDPVDRTGGGDAFAAGFLAGFYLGRDLFECGEAGNRLAARVIMGKGARPTITIPEGMFDPGG